MMKNSYNTLCSNNAVNDPLSSIQAPTAQKPMLTQMLHLDEIPLFKGLTRKEMDWLRGRLYQRVFPLGIEVMTAGTHGEFVYVILSGTMKVFVPQLDGPDVILAILGPGDPVGEMSVVDQAGRSATVITLEESSVVWMNRVDFQAALNTVPRISQNLLQILSNRLRSSTDQIQALAALDVNRRVVRQLLTFADRYGRSDSRGAVLISIRLTQNDLAELVGASRKRVNQVIVYLKQNHWLEVDGGYHITLLDPQALRDLQ